MSTTNNNTLQFLDLPFVKKHFQFTDNQDDDILLAIIQSCNLEMKKRIVSLADDLTKIEGTSFFQPTFDAALVFCEAEKLRRINKQYDEAAKTMTQFNVMMVSLIDLYASVAPERLSRIVSARDVDPEDDYFAERHHIA